MSFPAISVIIPALNYDDCLKALIAQLSDWDIFEIIIITPEGADPAPKLDETCQWLTAQKGRGPQIQAGLNKAQGEILWILHADSQPPKQSISDIRRIIKNPHTSMGCFPLKFNSPNLSLKLFAAFSHLRSGLTTFGDQGFFFHREFKNELPDLTAYPLLEDVIIYRALRKKGRVVKAKHALITDGKRFKRMGIWQTQWHNALTLWKFQKGTSARQLYEEYYA